MNDRAKNKEAAKAVLAESFANLTQHDQSALAKDWGEALCAMLETMICIAQPLLFFRRLKDHSVASGVITGIIEIFCEQAENGTQRAEPLMGLLRLEVDRFRVELNDTEQVLFITALGMCANAAALARHMRSLVKPQAFGSIQESPLHSALFQDPVDGHDNQAWAIMEFAEIAGDTLELRGQPQRDAQYREHLKSMRPRLPSVIEELWFGVDEKQKPLAERDDTGRNARPPAETTVLTVVGGLESRKPSVFDVFKGATRRRAARKEETATRLKRQVDAAVADGRELWSLPGAAGFAKALGMGVPGVVGSMFFDDSATGLLKNQWKATDAVIDDFAAFLCWRLAIYSFNDLPEKDDRSRDMLMDVAGSLFPPSERCTRHVLRWSDLQRDPSELRGRGLVIFGDATDDEVRTNITAVIIGELLSLFTLDSVRALSPADVLEYMTFIKLWSIQWFKGYRELCVLFGALPDHSQEGA